MVSTRHLTAVPDNARLPSTAGRPRAQQRARRGSTSDFAEQDGDGGWRVRLRSPGGEMAGVRVTTKRDDGIGLLVRHEQPGAGRIEAEASRCLPPRRLVPDEPQLATPVLGLP